MILAIDTGYTNIGYALGKPPLQLIAYGTLRPKQPHKEVYGFLLDLHKTHYLTLIALEQFRVYTAKAQLHKTIEIAGVIKLFASQHQISLQEISPRSWQTRFEKLKLSIIPSDWQTALTSGSEHSRDAVKILLTILTR